MHANNNKLDNIHARQQQQTLDSSWDRKKSHAVGR